MTYHSWYNYKCPNCGLKYAPFYKEITCPRCGTPSTEVYDMVGESLLAWRSHKEMYGRGTPPAYALLSLGDVYIFLSSQFLDAYFNSSLIHDIIHDIEFIEQFLSNIFFEDDEYLKEHFREYLSELIRRFKIMMRDYLRVKDTVNNILSKIDSMIDEFSKQLDDVVAQLKNLQCETLEIQSSSPSCLVLEARKLELSETIKDLENEEMFLEFIKTLVVNNINKFKWWAILDYDFVTDKVTYWPSYFLSELSEIVYEDVLRALLTVVKKYRDEVKISGKNIRCLIHDIDGVKVAMYLYMHPSKEWLLIILLVDEDYDSSMVNEIERIIERNEKLCLEKYKCSVDERGRITCLERLYDSNKDFEYRSVYECTLRKSLIDVYEYMRQRTLNMDSEYINSLRQF